MTPTFTVRFEHTDTGETFNEAYNNEATARRVFKESKIKSRWYGARFNLELTDAAGQVLDSFTRATWGQS